MVAVTQLSLKTSIFVVVWRTADRARRDFHRGGIPILFSVCCWVLP
jgi:hypothetical protein